MQALQRFNSAPRVVDLPYGQDGVDEMTSVGDSRVARREERILAGLLLVMDGLGG